MWGLHVRLCSCASVVCVGACVWGAALFGRCCVQPPLNLIRTDAGAGDPHAWSSRGSDYAFMDVFIISIFKNATFSDMQLQPGSRVVFKAPGWHLLSSWLAASIIE